MRGAVPAIWYTDNGPGFRAELLEGTAIGFYDRWGMTQKNSLPYNSQARGVVERFQQVWVKASRRLPTYKGRDMRSAHQRLVHEKGLDDGHFIAVAGHLADTLNQMGVPEDLIHEVLGAVEGLRDEVLDR